MPNYLNIILFSASSLICFILPIVLGIVIKLRYKLSFSIFFSGILACILSQFILFLPFIHAFSSFMQFHEKLQNPILDSLVLGLAAGIFQEGIRFLFAKFLSRGKGLYYQKAVFFGSGFGGIQMIILAGFSSIINLIASIQIALYKPPFFLSFLPLDWAKVWQSSFDSASLVSILGGIIEQSSLFLIQILLCLLAFFAFTRKRKFRFFFLSLCCHIFIESGSYLITYFSPWQPLSTNIYFPIIAIILYISIFFYNKKGQKKQPHFEE